ncbi:UDP-N-acetylmuramoyl-tripeptide--D-alanyl-D-alanine ligase [Oceaniferula spumae]|uniref:UDP-N-acetylmuramoyl-tripeptide--D-alanyl-D-alanine ligase n=1 Tax=Oceaniferula spumae TaxID=2979115 RepID=A0AAT9FQZ4_9BACT
MKPLSIAEIVTATGGELVGNDTGRTIRAISTDTRSLGEGSLFVALRGDHFDGHNFVGTAVENGAECLMLDTLPENADELEVPVLLVKNTLYGLQRLAKWYRDHLDIKVIGITGSNGKTSTKDFTAAVLRQKFKVNATKGNLNNHIGLPLSVLSTEEDDQVCVWEMGMNHAGEIAPLCDISSPDIGIITNIGTAHIEFLGSREGIAEEKASLARALPENGTLVVTASCDFVDYLIERSHAKTIVAGNCRGAVRAENLHVLESGSAFDLCIDGQDPVPVEIKVSGKHMVNNALLAAAAGYALGMSASEIAAGLNGAELTTGRLRRYDSQGITVIDDTYNANPDSVVAAIETLTDLPIHNGGRRVVVLGMMAELGKHADTEHLRVGRLAAEKKLQVVSVGQQAEKIYQGAHEVSESAVQFENPSDAAAWLKEFCKEGDRVLFKGSRMAGMENVMNEAFPQT